MRDIQNHPLLLKREMDAAIHKACLANGCPELQAKIDIVYSNALTRAAGKASMTQNRISLSIALLRRCDKAEQIETVVHEACHLIAWHKYRHRGHGQAWKITMRIAGYKDPRRCHTIDRAGLRRSEAKANGPIVFSCLCRKRIEVTPLIAKRILEGSRIYRCLNCHKEIQKIA